VPNLSSRRLSPPGPTLFGAAELREAGTLLYGEKWHRPLCEALGHLRGRPVLVQMAYQWAAGTKPVPGWVAAALPIVMGSVSADLRTRAERIDAYARAAWIAPAARIAPAPRKGKA
jgi:hypothetical protein